MTAPDRIDAHLHLWRADGGPGWLAGAPRELQGDFGPEDAATQLRAAGVTGAVLVQADDTDADTERLLEVAAATPWVLGVVGWISLDDAALAERQLERYATNPLFRGVRQLIHDDPRPDVLGTPSARRVLRQVATAGLAFDVPDAWPNHLEAATELARELPELTIVLDHLGKPPREAADYAAWRDALARFAGEPGTVAKVSGLRRRGTPYTTAAIRPTWEHALEVFGVERLMFGGDWPMTVADGGYAPTAAVLAELIDGLGPQGRSALWAGTARRVYRLPDAEASR